ncbi:MAG TPA: hypothetical protein VF037_08295 [Gemmatimonadales bacterium]
MRTRHAVPVVMLLAAGCSRTPISSSPVPETGDRVRYALTSGEGTLHRARAVRITPDTLYVERLVPSMTGGPARWEPAGLAMESLARLEKRVGRRGSPGKGALIGAGAGLLMGVFCANEDGGWLQPSPAQCLFGAAASGAATGAVLGALIRRDVWQPVVLPLQPRPAPGAVSGVSLGMGFRAPLPGRPGARR